MNLKIVFLSLRYAILVTVVAQLAVTPLAFAEEGATVTKCDLLAAHPSDSERIAEGVSFKNLDVNTAIAACKTAIESLPNSPRLQYQYGRSLFKTAQPEEAVSWFRLAAEQSYSQAQYGLGRAYLKGRGVAKSYKEAVSWFRLAAEQGNAASQFNLGWAFAKGRGVIEDHKEAAMWYRLAAVQGFPFAQINLGFMYTKGRGVTKNEKESLKW